MKNETIRSGLGACIGISLLSIAAWMLHHQLAKYDFHDILFYMAGLPDQQLVLAICCTGLSYAIMIGYDLLAMRYIRRSLPVIHVGFAAFVSYAFSNTIGLSLLTSGSVRYRFYSRWGLSAAEITKVLIFTALTLWLGILSIGGGMLAFTPLDLPFQLLPPLLNTKLLGMMMLIVPGGYFLLGLLRRQPLRFWRWELSMVRPRLALPQILVGALDWAIAGTVLYVLLPQGEGLNYSYFLMVFLVAQTAGLISHVPGGLGVFESIILLLLSPYMQVGNLIGPLLVYRLIYYLLPLALATVVLGIHEGRCIGSRGRRPAA